MELTQSCSLDLTDVRDDGNDPLRPLIARACAYIEAARQEGGTVLVHCVSHPCRPIPDSSDLGSASWRQPKCEHSREYSEFLNVIAC